jgi:hypothetical protein
VKLASETRAERENPVQHFPDAIRQYTAVNVIASRAQDHYMRGLTEFLSRGDNPTSLLVAEQNATDFNAVCDALGVVRKPFLLPNCAHAAVPRKRYGPARGEGQ